MKKRRKFSVKKATEEALTQGRQARERLAAQNRKLLGKHYASKYGVRKK